MRPDSSNICISMYLNNFNKFESLDSPHLFGWPALSMMIYGACNSLWFSWATVAVEARKTVEIDPFLIINQLVPDSQFTSQWARGLIRWHWKSNLVILQPEGHVLPPPPTPWVSCTMCQYIYDNTCMDVYDFPCACIFPTSVKTYPWQMEHV